MKARVSILHVLHDTRWVLEAAKDYQPVEVLNAISRMGVERARREVGRTLAKAGLRVRPVDILIAEGRAQDVIARESARGVALTLVGTHGRRGAARLFLGSVAEAVVRHARSPVLVVRGSRGKGA
jgi:nucleotide-binding universal stress UspA family protein